MNRGESRQPCFISDRSGKAFIFYHWIRCPLCSFHVWLVLSGSSFLLFLVCWVLFFYHKKKLSFVKCFFCTNWEDHVDFYPFILLNVIYYNDWVLSVKTCLPSRNKSCLVSCYIILLICCQILFANILLRIFTSMFIRYTGFL